MTPNKAEAVVVMDRLMQEYFTLGNELLKQRDPEGRTLNLGVTMFFGAVLACIKTLEDRQLMCDAAIGYSLQCHQILERKRQMTGG
jgi:hypothetical protein